MTQIKDNKIVEIKDLRSRFGGNKDAINRHSTRVYMSPSGKFYELDRTLDSFPSFFTLYNREDIKMRNGEIIHITSRRNARLLLSNYMDITVEGLRYWGENLTWKQAEHKAFETIIAFENK